MRRSRNVGVALIGLLVVAAISVAAGSGRKPVVASGAISMRMLTDAEVAQVSQRFPSLGSGIAQLRSDLLERLFPGTSFYKAFSYASMPPIPYLRSVYGDSLLGMPAGFNRLLLLHHMKVDDKNSVELAEAFVILAVGSEMIVDRRRMVPGRLDSLPHVTFLEAKTIKLKADLSTDDAAILRVMIGNQMEEWHFSVLRGQFKGAARVNEKGFIKDFPCVIVESLPVRGQLNPTPDMVIDLTKGETYVEHDPRNNAHYYVTADSNLLPTGHRVFFSLTGFPPSQTDVYLRVRDSIRHTTMRFKRVTIDTNGCGGDSWTPPDSLTGIFLASAGHAQKPDTEGTYVGATADRELTPERLKVGTFPSADGETLKIYYCDQFFKAHPDSEQHAVVFQRYVDSAMVAAWRVQVGSWSLGAPPDADHKHRVFVHDAMHWYHMEIADYPLYDTGANRQINIPARFRYLLPVCSLYTSESILVMTALAHEFYHGIQWGRDSRKLKDRAWNWFNESQARFIESAQYPDENFADSGGIKNGIRKYAEDADTFLLYNLNTSLVDPYNYLQYGYQYCLFWRLLYEEFGSAGVADGVQLVRDCYAANVGTNNSIGRGKAAIDAGIQQWSLDHNGALVPGYDNFLQCLDQFALACYLNDTSFHLSDTSFHRWYDPHKVYVPPHHDKDTAFYLGPAERDYVEVIDSIPHSFGIDFVQVALDRNVDTVQVSVMRDTGAGRILSARVVVVDPPGGTEPLVIDPPMLAPPDSSTSWDSLKLPVKGAERVCLVTTRRDTLDNAGCIDTARFKVKRAVAVTELLPVTDTIIAYTEFIPRAVVENRGWMKEIFPVTYEIPGIPGSNTKTCTLDVGKRDTVEFDTWTIPKGHHTTWCWVYIASDPNRGDDTLRGSLVALADTWEEMSDVPGYVSWGGALASVGDTAVYAFRGNASTGFYCY